MRERIVTRIPDSKNECPCGPVTLQASQHPTNRVTTKILSVNLPVLRTPVLIESISGLRSVKSIFSTCLIHRRLTKTYCHGDGLTCCVEVGVAPNVRPLSLGLTGFGQTALSLVMAGNAARRLTQNVVCSDNGPDVYILTRNENMSHAYGSVGL